MPYRTNLELTSGDRTALDAAVESLRSVAASKGAEVTGPHSRPSRTISVPMYKRLDKDDVFDTWEYEICVRELIVTGHEGVARSIAAKSLPASVAVSMTLEHVEPPGKQP